MKNNNRKGQVALIIVMLIAAALTVVLSISFQSVVDTQTSKLEEENQKTLAAAEAAVEASLNSNASTTLGQGSLNNISGITGGATISSTTDNIFTSKKVEKNDQYTFYLSNYDPTTKTLGTTSLQEAVTVCYQGSTTNPALEITLLKNNSIKRYAIDHDSRINSAISPSAACLENSAFQYSYTIPSADIGTDTRLIIVKVLFNGTKLFFSRTDDFPLQGKLATSDVTSQVGVSKKVSLFQTYPQIPADFFNTSF